MEELRWQSAAMRRPNFHGNDLSAKPLLLTVRYDRFANGPDTQLIPDFFCKSLYLLREVFLPSVL